ncbi:hypothetical protein KEM52_006409, partial [Ascosphaera acerosa]
LSLFGLPAPPPVFAFAAMSKREATFQGDKSRGLIDMNQQPADVPRRATAAQIAQRKIKAARSSRSRHGSPGAGAGAGAPAAPPVTTFGAQQQNDAPAASTSSAFGGMSGFGSGFNFSVGSSATPSNPFAQQQAPQAPQSQPAGGFSGFKGSIFNVPPSIATANTTPSSTLFGSGPGTGQSASFTFGSTSSPAPASATAGGSGGGIFGSSSFTAGATSAPASQAQQELGQFKVANTPADLARIAANTPSGGSLFGGGANQTVAPFAASSGVLGSAFAAAPAAGNGNGMSGSNGVGGDAMETSPDVGAAKAKGAATTFPAPTATAQPANLFGSAATATTAPATAGATPAVTAAAAEPPKFGFGSAGSIFGARASAAPTTTAATATATTSAPAAASTTTATASPFGAAQPATSSPFATFGSSVNTASTPSLFGSASSQPAPAPATTTTTTATTAAPTPSLFGQPASAPAPAAATATSTPSLFGGFGQPKQQETEQQKEQDKPATAASLFGAAPSSSAPESTTKPAASLFGASTPATTETATTTTQPANPFASASASASPFSASTVSTSASGPFAAFGSKPAGDSSAETSKSATPLFGAAPSPAPFAGAQDKEKEKEEKDKPTAQSLFGGGAASFAPASTEPAKKSLFGASLSGAAPAPQPAPAAATTTTTSTAPAAEKPLFGASTQTPSASTSLFGRVTQPDSRNHAEKDAVGDRIKASKKGAAQSFKPRTFGPTVSLSEIRDDHDLLAFDRMWRLRALNETLKRKISEIDVQQYSIDTVLEFYLAGRKAIGCPLGRPVGSNKRKYAADKEALSNKRSKDTNAGIEKRHHPTPKPLSGATSHKAADTSAAAPAEQSSTASLFASSFNASQQSGSSSTVAKTSGGEDQPQQTSKKQTTTPSPEPPASIPLEQPKPNPFASLAGKDSNGNKDDDAEATPSSGPSLLGAKSGPVFGQAVSGSSPFLTSAQSTKPSEQSKPSSSLFGSAAPTSKTPLFGATASTTISPSSAPGKAGDEAPKTLFGNPLPKPAANPFATAASGPSVFAQSSSPSSLFGQPTAATGSGSVFASTPSKPAASESAPAASQGDDEDKTDDPQVDLLRPKLADDEAVLFELRCQLLKLETGAGWKVQGLGLARVMKNKKTNKAYLVHRLDPNGRVLLNAPLSPKLKYTARDRAVTFTAPVEGGSPENYMLRAGKAAVKDAEEMAKVLEENKKGE